MDDIQLWRAALAISLVLPTLLIVQCVLLVGLLQQRKRLAKDREVFATVRHLTSARRTAKPMNQWKKH